MLPKVRVFEDGKFQRLVDHFETTLANWPKDERPEAMDTPHLPIFSLCIRPGVGTFSVSGWLIRMPTIRK